MFLLSSFDPFTLSSWLSLSFFPSRFRSLRVLLMIPINLELLGFPISQSELAICREKSRSSGFFFLRLSGQTKYGQHLQDEVTRLHIMSFLISVQSFTLLSFGKHYFSLDPPPIVISINPAKERFYVNIKIQTQDSNFGSIMSRQNE